MPDMASMQHPCTSDVESFIEHFPGMIWTISNTAEVTYANKNWIKYTGFNKAKELGRRWLEKIHPDDLSRYLHRWQTAQNEQQPFDIEYRFQRHDGVYRWQLSHFRPMGKKPSSKSEWIISANDIDDRKRAEQHASLLSGASKLLASSLNCETTLGTVGELVVSKLADWCVIDLIASENGLKRVVIAHADPAQKELAQWMKNTPVNTDSRNPYASMILKSKQSVIVPTVTEAQMAASVQDSEHLDLLRAIKMKSRIHLPLISRGRALGIASFAWVEGGRIFDPSDVPLFEELSHHMALAIDNANLYENAEFAEQRYRGLCESIPQIMWTGPEDGSIDYFNRRWFEYTGLQARNCTSFRDIRSAIHTDDWQSVYDRWEQAFDIKQPAEFECRIKKQDGLYRWHLCRTVPIVDHTGTITRWIGAAMDIDDKRRAEEERIQLHESERESQRRASFLNHASKALGSTLNYETILKVIVELTTNTLGDGVSIDSLDENGELTNEISHSLNSIPHLSKENIPAIISDGEPVIRSRDGNSIIIAPLRVRGNLRGSLSIWRSSSLPYSHQDFILVQDFADRCSAAVDKALLYRDAQNAIQMREEFLAIASHELRTPLTSLHMELQMLIEDLERGKNVDVLQAALICEKQSQRLKALIEGLLELTRIKSGNLRLQRRQLDLGQLVGDVLGRFQRVRDSNPAQFHVNLSTPHSGFWDPGRIDQVITNLICNAIKYGAGKPIYVLANTDPTRGIATIKISDHGEGIADEMQEKIFEKFSRTFTEPNISGLGLGLYIVKQIVEAHRGRVYLSSKTGEGSTFTVELPLVAA